MFYWHIFLALDGMMLDNVVTLSHDFIFYIA